MLACAPLKASRFECAAFLHTRRPTQADHHLFHHPRGVSALGTGRLRTKAPSKCSFEHLPRPSTKRVGDLPLRPTPVAVVRPWIRRAERLTRPTLDSRSTTASSRRSMGPQASIPTSASPWKECSRAPHRRGLRQARQHRQQRSPAHPRMPGLFALRPDMPRRPLNACRQPR